MYSWITEIINAVTNFIANFSKLNNATMRSVKIFGAIILIGTGAFFLVKLFMRDDLYDKLMNMNPITFAVIIGAAMIAYGWYSQKRMMNAVLTAIKMQKEKEKETSEEAYKQTSRIEEQARSLTKALIGKLNGDVATVEMLHNKDVFDGGVHCRYYSECYPSTRDGIFFDARQYQRMPTAVLPIVSYMENHDYYFDTIDNLKAIDMGYAKGAEVHNDHHIALKFMRKKNGKPLGILTCSWRDGLGDTMPNKETIKEEMDDTASKLEFLLDIDS